MDKKPNHLLHETSPYLLQHAYNPVDWYPWGEEAFEKASTENKAVFLSIGYSSCHWCHVMEQESFENEEVAAYLNQHFIAIKVDREERPDIDAAFMDFAVASTGSGGWPLSVFLTPEKGPFFAGTYFPSHPRYGMPSFMQVLQMVKEQFEQHPEAIAAFIGDMRKHFQALSVEQHQQITEGVLRKFDEVFEQQYDNEHGGMLGMPKFPITLSLLLCMFRKKQLDKVFHTLKKMGNGGIYDQLGGGFFRYAVDEGWRVPHFEKMLYDNALLLKAYAWAFALSKDAYFKEKAEEIFAFVMRELYSGKGFYSGIDADSEGEEGKHYVFSNAEIEKVVGDALLLRYYCVEEHGEFEGKNVLRANTSLQLDEEQLARIADAKKKLLQYREQRVRSAVDSKILVSWNSLMISGMVAYGRYCEHPEALELAGQVAGRLLQECWDGKRLLRVAGKQTLPGFLEDYSFLLRALLDVYEVSFDNELLELAGTIADVAIELFYQDRFYDTSKEHDALFFRRYSAQDNVIPAGCSMMITALFRLGLHQHHDDYQKLVEGELQLNLERMQQHPLHYQTLLMVVAGMLGDFYHVVVQGDENYVRNVHKALLQIPLFSMQLSRGEGKENSILVCGKQKCQSCSSVDEVEKIVRGNVQQD